LRTGAPRLDDHRVARTTWSSLGGLRWAVGVAAPGHGRAPSRGTASLRLPTQRPQRGRARRAHRADRERITASSRTRFAHCQLQKMEAAGIEPAKDSLQSVSCAG
jgi:hypothetical protein